MSNSADILLQQSPNDRGFTLVELVVVAVLLAVMSSVLYGTLSGILRTKRTLESQRIADRTAQYFLPRITRELTNRVPQAFMARDDKDAQNQAKRKRFFLGKNRKIGERDADLIKFSSAGSGQPIFEGQQNFGVVEVTYSLSEAGREDKTLTRNPGLVLIREEVPAGVNSKEIIEQRRIVFPLSERIDSLNFRYRRNGRWLDEWSEKRSGFPEAVEITIGVRGEDGGIESFRTAVSVAREEDEL